MAATRAMWTAQTNTGQNESSTGALDSAHHNQVCALRPFGASFGGPQAHSPIGSGYRSGFAPGGLLPTGLNTQSMTLAGLYGA